MNVSAPFPDLRSAGASAGSASAAARDAALDPKLVAAAHQFEASLMRELLKPLNSGPLFGGGDGDSGSEAGGGLSGLTSEAEGSAGALLGFGSEALARAISQKGGLGIARRVLDHFEAESAARREAGGRFAVQNGKLNPLLK